MIAGVCKGKSLKPVPGRSTRPTTDKVKEALFNRIGPFFGGGRGFDLYSGSGALGIEALSRGMDEMIFVDRDPKAVNVIQENADRCRFQDRSEIFRADAGRAMKAAHKRGLRFSIIFLDPPYFHRTLKEDIRAIDHLSLLTASGLVVIEHHEAVTLADSYGRLRRTDRETYGGKTVISIYTNQSGEGINT